MDNNLLDPEGIYGENLNYRPSGWLYSTILAIVVGIIVLLLNVAPAEARNHPCGDYRDGKASMLEDWGSVPVWSGLSNAGTALELVQNAEGEWVLFQIWSNGKACLIANGTGGDTVTLPAPGSPA